MKERKIILLGPEGTNVSIFFLFLIFNFISWFTLFTLSSGIELDFSNILIRQIIFSLIRPISKNIKKNPRTIKSIKTKYLNCNLETNNIDEITNPIIIDVPKSGCWSIRIKIPDKKKNNRYVLFLWFLFFIRLSQILNVSNSDFEKYIITGFISLLAFQIIANISTVTGLLPLTGLPFPLLSLGGSSMVSTSIIFGITNRIFIENNLVI